MNKWSKDFMQYLWTVCMDKSSDQWSKDALMFPSWWFTGGSAR